MGLGGLTEEGSDIAFRFFVAVYVAAFFFLNRFSLCLVVGVFLRAVLFVYLLYTLLYTPSLPGHSSGSPLSEPDIPPCQAKWSSFVQLSPKLVDWC